MNKKGFTIVELLVVIAIIGILSGTIVVSMNSRSGDEADSKIKSSMSQLRSIAETYKFTIGEGYYEDEMFTSGTGKTLIDSIVDNGGSFIESTPIVNEISWCLAVQLNNGNWCIDYTGYSVNNKKCSTSPYRCSVNI